MRKYKYRFIIMIFTGIIISMVIDSVKSFDTVAHNHIIDSFISIFITVVIWEGNLIIDEKLNSKISWIKTPLKRILVQAPIFIVYSTLVILIPMFLYQKTGCKLTPEQEKAITKTCLIIGLLFSVILLAIEIGAQFFGQWKKSLIEVEKYKLQSIQAELQNLKNQINPHFLFNNMSVLSSLVYKDQDKAVDFINQLSKVYRYLLDNKDNELVTLEEEMTFIKSYIYLLQIRFDTNIKFELKIDEQSLSKLLPPMSLQILLENTIKHNEISTAQPLTVSVTSTQGFITVNNNLQRRLDNETSCNTGLKNISERYAYFTDTKINITENSNFFSVEIPLLNNSK